MTVESPVLTHILWKTSYKYFKDYTDSCNLWPLHWQWPWVIVSV